MYRETRKSREYRLKREAKERKRLEGESPDYPKELPKLRRIIVVIDFDFGKKVNIFRCFKSARINQYDVEVNGKFWKTVGFAGILAGIRKAMPVVRRI